MLITRNQLKQVHNQINQPYLDKFGTNKYPNNKKESGLRTKTEQSKSITESVLSSLGKVYTDDRHGYDTENLKEI